MSTIAKQQGEYQVFELFYNSLTDIRDNIDHEIAHSLSNNATSTTARKLLKLRDSISNAINTSGEAMFEAVRIMGHELTLMKEAYDYGR